MWQQIWNEAAEGVELFKAMIHEWWKLIPRKK